MKAGTVSILGCGWLGVPLGKHLRNRRFSVKGSVTSPEKFNLLRTSGIEPYRIILSDLMVEVDDPAFFETDVLVISIPPRRIDGIERIFPTQIAQLIPIILKSGIRKVIFISSTSVYPENLKTASENDVLSPDKESGKACLAAENLLNHLTDFETTIIRFGGLIGANRKSGPFSPEIGSTGFKYSGEPDSSGRLCWYYAAILEKDIWGETLNACCPEHPLKKDFYGKAAQISGIPMPLISDRAEAYKIVDSSKLKRLLKYKFKYPSPMDYLDSLVASKK